MLDELVDKYNHRPANVINFGGNFDQGSALQATPGVDDPVWEARNDLKAQQTQMDADTLHGSDVTNRPV